MEYILHNLCYLLFQSVDEELWRIFVMLYVAELLLPNTSEFTTGEELFVDGVDELYARGSSHEVLAFPTEVVALEQRLNDAGT